MDFGPLFNVLGRWCFERPAHFMNVSATVWTDSGVVGVWRNLEALAAIEAGVSDQVFSWHVTSLHRRLTPELSRPVTGRQTCASVAQSTRLTPRHGVGLNELLGGWDADRHEAPANLPKAEAGRPERAPRTLRRPSPKERVRRCRTNSRRTLSPKLVSETHM